MMDINYRINDFVEVFYSASDNENETAEVCERKESVSDVNEKDAAKFIKKHRFTLSIPRLKIQEILDKENYSSASIEEFTYKANRTTFMYQEEEDNYNKMQNLCREDIVLSERFNTHEGLRRVHQPSFKSTSASTYETNETDKGGVKDLRKRKKREEARLSYVSNFNSYDGRRSIAGTGKLLNIQIPTDGSCINTTNEKSPLNCKILSKLGEQRRNTTEINKKINEIDSKLRNEGEKVDINYFKKFFTSLRINNSIPKNIEIKKENHLENLFEIQSFNIDTKPIWVAVISHDGTYLATGGKSGVLTIWKFYDITEAQNINDIKKGVKLINETPFRNFKGHSEDIIAISWSHVNENQLLSASFDKTVILWDVTKEVFLRKFDHPGIVSCVTYIPGTSAEDEIFISGCTDKFIRIWSPSKKNILDYINLQEFIISIVYSPSSFNIIVGLHNGKCSVFEYKPRLKYTSSFDCKNKVGKFSDGRKVNSLEFINKNQIMISTNDSRIRLVNALDGKTVQKYKGHSNLEYPIKASFDEMHDLVISASDDGYVYLWKKIENSENIKNSKFESFRPFDNDISIFSFFANDLIYQNYLNTFKLYSNKVFVKSVILNISKSGCLKVLSNLIQTSSSSE